MKISSEYRGEKVRCDVESIDIISEDDLEIEFQEELGVPNSFKLYLHDEKTGKTLIRVCKIKPEKIKLPISFFRKVKTGL